MNFKQFIVSSMVVLSSFDVSAPVFAQNLSEAEIRSMVEQRSTADKKHTVDKITYNDAVYEGKSMAARAAKVTESAAYLDKVKDTLGLMEEAAEGYVTVKDGSTDVYHYTRAELYRDGSLCDKSSNLYGSGRVYAKTNFHFVDKNATSKAKVFYGGF